MNFNIKLYKGFWVIIIFIILLPFVYLFTQVHPVYDDFWYAAITKKYGYFGAQKWWYISEGGRYISSIIISLDSYLAIHINIYRIVLFVCFVLLLLSINTLIKYIIKLLKVDNHNLSTILSIILITYFFNILAGVSEIIYWLPGIATYTIGIAALNIIASILFLNYQQKNKNLYLIIACIIACGVGEFVATTAIALMGIKALISFVQNNKKIDKKFVQSIYLLPFVITIICYVINIKAIGNQNRLDITKHLYPNAGNFNFAIHNSIVSSMKFLYNITIVRKGFLLILISLIVSSLYVNNKKNSFIKIAPNWLFFQLILLSITVIYEALYIYSSGLSGFISRVQSLPTYLWALNFIVTGILISTCFNTITEKDKNKFALSSILLFVFMIFSSHSTNIKDAYSDILTKKIENYNIYKTQQEQDFKNCNDSLIISRNPVSKTILDVWDLSNLNYKSRYYNYYKGVLCGNIDWDNFQLQ